MSIVVAYEFRSTKTLDAMLALLHAGTPWEWRERSSDIWDDYLSATVAAGVIVKVFKQLEPFGPQEPGDEDHFHLEIKFVSEEAVRDFAELTQHFMDELMPLLEAAEIKPTSSYDR